MDAPRDRISELYVEGMRALGSVRLPLGGLRVLIGDNGSGKSSLLEALELLRKAARPGSFVSEQMEPFHGDLGMLLRQGAAALRLGARIEGGGPAIEYGFAVARQGRAAVIAEERLDVWADGAAAGPLRVIDRDLAGCRVLEEASKPPSPLQVPSGQLALTSFGAFAPSSVARVLDVLGRGRVHVPFDVQPLWISAEQQRRPPLREPAQISRTHEVERLGGNLANAYFALAQERPREVWERTLERVRAGLGADV
ncbi:MAG TPA: AAA family ATPase, partial [Candidatus Nanopelagicales bacterium]|nr:AAA family ATPase [Candidatus Nanopelagicales bacterium]